jgi:hypothetical protein
MMGGQHQPAKIPFNPKTAPQRRPKEEKRHSLRPRSGFAAAAATSLLLMAATGLREEVVRAAPPLARAYAAIGLPVNLRGLEIRDLKSSLERDGSGTLLDVEGTIVNIRSRKVTVPPVWIGVEGPDGQESYSWTTAAPKAQLANGETIDFRARLSDPPEAARAVLVQFAKP